MVITRRSALIGSLSTLFAAPAIVRATSIMPVSVRAVEVYQFNVIMPRWDSRSMTPNNYFTLANVGDHPIKIGPDMMLMPGERRVMGGGCYPLTITTA